MAQGSVEVDDLGAGTSNDIAQQRHARNDSPEPQAPSPDFSLPPVDRGKQAWLFLAACWAVEALVFGECSPARVCVHLPGSHGSNQVPAFLSASSRTSTAIMSRLRVQAISPSSGPPRW